MLQGPAILIAVAGGAFLAVSYAPTVLQARTDAPRHVAMTAGVSSKGDRLVAPVRPSERVATTVVEVVGVSQPVVILKAQDGSVLFRSDPVVGSTLVVKNADLPVVTVREGISIPVAYQSPSQSEPASYSPERAQEGGEAPAPKRKPRTVGCEGSLSSLVKGAGASAASRCVV